jgi:F-type H+-transporting ATPase subunit alpha
MELKAEEISQIIKEQITDYDKKVELSETGVVLSVGDGIARIYGLENVMALELVEFPGAVLGLVLNLEEDNVGVAVMGEDIHIKEGDIVKRTGRIAQVPVGEAVLGRVLSAVGKPLDGKGPIDAKEHSRVEVVAPGVIARKSVHEPCYTGLKAVSGNSLLVTARLAKPPVPLTRSWRKKTPMFTAYTWPAGRKNPP